MISSKTASLRNCRLHRKICLNARLFECPRRGSALLLTFALLKGVPGNYNNAGGIEFTIVCICRSRERGPILPASPGSGVSPDHRVARLCPTRCFALRASQIWPRHMRQNNTTGKSAKPVQCSQQKYSAFAVGQISGLTLRVSPDERGVRTSRTRGEMRWTREP